MVFSSSLLPDSVAVRQEVKKISCGTLKNQFSAVLQGLGKKYCSSEPTKELGTLVNTSSSLKA